MNFSHVTERRWFHQLCVKLIAGQITTRIVSVSSTSRAHQERHNNGFLRNNMQSQAFFPSSPVCCCWSGNFGAIIILDKDGHLSHVFFNKNERQLNVAWFSTLLIRARLTPETSLAQAFSLLKNKFQEVVRNDCTIIFHFVPFSGKFFYVSYVHVDHDYHLSSFLL